MAGGTVPVNRYKYRIRPPTNVQTKFQPKASHVGTVAVHNTAMPSVCNLAQDSQYNPSFRDPFRDFIQLPLIALEAIVQNHPISVVLIVGFFGGDVSNLEWSWASSRTLIHPATPISRFPIDQKHVFCPF
ncbi:hypothetical protein B0H13DRAFT_2273545, partial [Mycena leptocephala]